MDIGPYVRFLGDEDRHTRLVGIIQFNVRAPITGVLIGDVPALRSRRVDWQQTNLRGSHNSNNSGDGAFQRSAPSGLPCGDISGHHQLVVFWHTGFR